MSSITFVDKTTVVPASWLNDVNNAVYSGLGMVAGSIPPSFTGTVGGIKNFLHNPGLSVAQRGITGSLAANTGTYCPDRWIVYSAGSTASWNIGTSGAPPFSPSYLYLGGATGNTGFSISQRLEAIDCAPLVGKTVTLSLAADCQGSISTLPITYSIYAPTSVDNWPGGYSSIATGTFATINTLWSRYSASFVMPTSAVNGLQITFTFGAVPASSAIAVGGFQLELGSVMTSVEIPCKAWETQRCQRYLIVRGGGNANEGIAVLQAVSTTVAYGAITFPNAMRVAPTPAYSAVTDFALTNNVGGFLTASAIGFVDAGVLGGEYQITIGSASLVAGNATRFLCNTTTNARLYLSAEL